MGRKITTDSSMLNQGPKLAALLQTKLTLVVATASGPSERFAEHDNRSTHDVWSEFRLTDGQLSAPVIGPS